MEQARETGSLEDKEYKNALAENKKLTRKDGIDAAFRKHKLDAIVGPTSGPAFLTDLVRATELAAAAPRRPLSPAIRISPFPPALNSDCHLEFHSSASAGRNRPWCDWLTPSNNRPLSDVHPAT